MSSWHSQCSTCARMYYDQWLEQCTHCGGLCGHFGDSDMPALEHIGRTLALERAKSHDTAAVTEGQYQGWR